MKIAVGAVLCLLLSACGHIPVPYQGYDGPPRPQSEVATVYTDWRGGFDAGYELLIRSVDDKSVGMKTSPLDPRNMLVSVAPGAHVLGVTLTWRSGVTGYVTVKEWKISVPIEARADRLYSICMLGKGRPEVELRDIGPTSARTTSQEEWQKYAMHPCI